MEPRGGPPRPKQRRRLTILAGSALMDLVKQHEQATGKRYYRTPRGDNALLCPFEWDAVFAATMKPDGTAVVTIEETEPEEPAYISAADDSINDIDVTRH